MGEKSSEIEQHIQDQRVELDGHINELGDKVRNAVDWRAQVDERPLVMIGAAFAGGILLSALFPPKRRPSNFSRREKRNANSENKTAWPNPYPEDPVKPKKPRALDTVKSALYGVAAAKVGNYLEEMIPGFNEEYRKS